MAGLQREIRSQKGRGSAFNLFSDTRFEPFRNVCDHEFRRLHKEGIGTEAKHVEAFTSDDERKLWESQVLTTLTPHGLLNCVFFYNGKNLCLRGGEEHRKLKFSQFRREQRVVDRVAKFCYVYMEHGSKNRAGGMGQLHLNNKVVHHSETPEAGERDYVSILDLYYSKVPKEAIGKDSFYVRPLSQLPGEEGKPWFTSVPLGRNKLGTMVKEMCLVGGVEGKKRNTVSVPLV